jgi:glutamyl-tRNA synthetase
MAAQPSIQEWVSRSTKFAAPDIKDLEAPFLELDAHLTLRSYIVGYGLTDADVAIFKAISQNFRAKSFVKQGSLRNAQRWFNYVDETHPELTKSVLAARPKVVHTKESEGGSFEIGLPDAERGVVTRFPPEPSYV